MKILKIILSIIVFSIFASTGIFCRSVENPNPIEYTHTIEKQTLKLNQEELFDQIQREIQEEQWGRAIVLLDTLRSRAPEYRVLEVDGMYHISFRNLGNDLILNKGKLEMGLYFLTLAEKYAPLEKREVMYFGWAETYLTGASWWDLNWYEAVRHFTSLMQLAPYLHDEEGRTTTDRYLVALNYYGDELVKENQYCDALQQYQKILEHSDADEIQTKYDDAYAICFPPAEIVEPTIEITIEPTLEETVEPAKPPDCGHEHDPSYPTICIEIGQSDLNCEDIEYRDFEVIGNDPHDFDDDDNGIGCEEIIVDS